MQGAVGLNPQQVNIFRNHPNERCSAFLADDHARPYSIKQPSTEFALDYYVRQKKKQTGGITGSRCQGTLQTTFFPAFTGLAV